MSSILYTDRSRIIWAKDISYCISFILTVIQVSLLGNFEKSLYKSINNKNTNLLKNSHTMISHSIT